MPSFAYGMTDEGRIVVGVPGLAERAPAPLRQAERDGLILVSLDARSAADLAYSLPVVAGHLHDVALAHTGPCRADDCFGEVSARLWHLCFRRSQMLLSVANSGLSFTVGARCGLQVI
jgi:hypothetical protein